MNNIKLVLIPGLDGTGILFEPFIELTPPSVEIQVIKLPDNSDFTYQDYALLAESLLGEEPIILIGESFGGKVAYEMLQSSKLNVTRIIFVASFLTKPSLLSRFASLVPTGVIKRTKLPTKLLNKLFFHSPSHERLINLFYEAISNVSATTLKSRLALIKNMEQPTHQIDIPCTYIKASNDYLVSPEASKPIEQCCSIFKSFDVTGGHFILQSNPTKCWEVLNSEIAL